MTALAGDDANPGIPTFDPDVGADLYTTNGDTNDHMYKPTKTISFTPEGTAAATGSVFVFQDDEADVQAEFERHVQFALDLARSATDPTHPVQPPRQQGAELRGRQVQRLVRQPADRAGERPPRPRPDPAALPRERRPDADGVHAEWQGGSRYGDEGDYWYHRMRGQVTGTKPGDNVEVWFTPRRSTRRATRSRTTCGRTRARDVLVLARRGLHRQFGPAGVRGHDEAELPRLLRQALDANGIDYDVYDYDARGARRRMRSAC